MKRRRVKVTGLGFVTPAGIGKSNFWKGILEPTSRASILKNLPLDAGSFVGVELKDFSPAHLLDGIQYRRFARHTQFALAATKLALSDAGLSITETRQKHPAIVVGASLMDFGSINKGIELILKKGPINGNLATVFSAPVSSIAGTIGDVIGGVNRTIALQSACCAGTDSIGKAAAMIAEGESELAICGGTEAPLFLHPLLELRMAGLSPANAEFPEQQCRPFDLWRTTGVIGEGACILILEPELSPRHGYSFIEGYSFASDSGDAPASGLYRAMQLALANARRSANEVDCVNAWGPGHKVIDSAESSALHELFGKRIDQIAVASIKGAIGNPLGAAGAIQAGCAALSLFHSIVPPTVNWRDPDPSCRLNLSPKARFLEHCVTIVNSHGLSGSNSSLVLSRQ